MNRRSKPLDKKGASSAKWVHNFLNHKDDIVIEPTDKKGIKKYTVTSLTNLMEDDYVVKWAESGLNKTIYQVISATGSNGNGTGNTGRIKDLIALDEVDSDAVHAILLVDRDAALQDLEEDDDAGFGER